MDKYKAVSYNSGYLIYRKLPWNPLKYANRWQCIYYVDDTKDINEAIKVYKNKYWADQTKKNLEVRSKEFSI